MSRTIIMIARAVQRLNSEVSYGSTLNQIRKLEELRVNKSSSGRSPIGWQLSSVKGHLEIKMIIQLTLVALFVALLIKICRRPKNFPPGKKILLLDNVRPFHRTFAESRKFPTH